MCIKYELADQFILEMLRLSLAHTMNRFIDSTEMDGKWKWVAKQPSAFHGFCTYIYKKSFI